MSLRQSAVLALLAASLLSFAPAPVQAADPSATTALQPREGWYKQLVDFDFMRANVDIPPKPGVLIVDSRPAARQYDPGHIPGAINIPDTQFDKQVARLPADKNTLLVFYCGGVDCPLSHNSAFKAEQLPPPSDVPVVLMCRSGRRASEALAVVEASGRADVGIFPGSMIECTEKNGPVITGP